MADGALRLVAGQPAGDATDDSNRPERTPTKTRSEEPWTGARRLRASGEDPELFFPVGTTGPALEQTERAKVVCRGCDVGDECLQWALATNQDAGVWGGTSEEERRSLRRSLYRSRQRRRRVPT